ncbi:Acetolactate synthase isozyme 2 small subunit [Marinobacter litoralis]|uniref:Acetolactate synthase isozyme 2 small subunit n=1 Tax=Marinobacter litoralis TaxID=187981 RepID=A0A3M2RKB8_9GAMM|nr:ACT domain-containing protein [Marinobacter litoralis]RMJ05662.1 Acetolactate synthase isozyme 2 small subunit [Marinobacter litoralis]
MSPQAECSTPSYNLNCRMHMEAAALERLCQVVRVRGFRISEMSMSSGSEHLDIALTLEGSRPIAMLKAQLEKLHTVAEVLVQPQSAVRSALG